MQLEATLTDCGKSLLLVQQEQGDSSPIIIVLPYDVTGMTLSGSIKFPAPISLTVGNELTVLDSSYSDVRTYNKDEQVYYLGIPYICTAKSTGNLPTNTRYWAISENFSEIKLQLTSTQTQDVPAGKYEFDFWTTGAFNTDPLLGYFQIDETITRVA